MKKILFVACLIFSTAAFSQSQQNTNYGNGHGQNDCQCTGIGLPSPYNRAMQSTTAIPGVRGEDKKSMEIRDLWFRYMQRYMGQLRTYTYSRKGK